MRIIDWSSDVCSSDLLAFAQNVCNFSVPGAGKTSIVYAAYAYLQSLPAEDPRSIERLLIIGPLSSFKAWEDEFEEIFCRKPDSRRISGATPLFERSDHRRGITTRSRQDRKSKRLNYKP